ncbi:MAG TPA: methylated-DNA--[protein]-cysteine S-methyltransferase [Anaerolineales bacterium]|nr:methylated-DNA--[protein]-cysteine S-methyltransferase [Anaerolineales bacterium]
MHRDEMQETDLAGWLGDTGERLMPDPMLAALDDLYAIGPDPIATRRAQEKLRETLREAGHEVVYYDCLGDTPVGPLYVAVTERGLLAVQMEAEEQGFLARLRRRTRADLVRSRARTAPVFRQLEGYFAGQRRAFRLEADLEALSGFQRRVLETAQQVRYGQITTYGEIAKRIGRPRAARAVGQALARNPLPIVIPCHRVLAADGSLTGYSGAQGLQTKAFLLRMEGAIMY